MNFIPEASEPRLHPLHPALGTWLDSISSQIRPDRIQAAIAELPASRDRLHSPLEGVDLEGYTIPEVVEDMEAARLALRYERINLLSASYGTRVAQIYAVLHPGSLRHSAMMGVNPPGRFVWEPDRVDAQLHYYAALWAQDARRSARTPDLAETLRKVVHHIPPHWLVFPIDPGKVRLVAFTLLFNRSTAAMVFDAFSAAGSGDPSGLWLMSFAYNFVVPRAFNWGDLLAKGTSADYDAGRDYALEMDPPDSILGSPLAKLIWGAARGAWPARLIPEHLRQVQPSEIPTLLVSGSVDFSTPAEYATRELLPSLENGQQVILHEFGHVGDLFSLRPQITQRLLTSFFATGAADDSLLTEVPMDFRVAFGFPLLAKVLLVINLIALASLILILFLLMR